MTHDETDFCNLVHNHALGYSALEFKLDNSGHFYNLRLKRLGAPEHETKSFTVFADPVREALATGQLPEGLLRSFAEELK